MQVNAWLVLLSFTGDTGISSASTPGAFDAAFAQAMQHFGFRDSAAVPGVVHVHVDVGVLG